MSVNEIHVGSITSKTNPLGTANGKLNDGIKAYFDTLNAQGGVWGRHLVLTSERDDKTGNNLTETEALLSQDNVYAAFEAVELFTGAKKLAAAGIPTYGWNINAEWNGPQNFFPNVRPICWSTKCSAIGRAVPWIVKQVGAHKVALIGYNVPQSANSVTSGANVITKFADDIDADVVYTDTSLSFGQTDYSAQVGQMKAKGVDFLETSLDFNGDFALAKEMQRQNILDKVTFFHPNMYDAEFVKKNAALFEGGIVLVGIVAAEHKPPPPALQEYLDYVRTHTHREQRAHATRLDRRAPVRRLAESRRTAFHLGESRERLEPAERGTATAASFRRSTGPRSTPTDRERRDALTVRVSELRAHRERRVRRRVRRRRRKTVAVLRREEARRVADPVNLSFTGDPFAMADVQP